MIDKLLTKISRRLPYKEICSEGKPYLERYFLAQFPCWQWLGKWVGGQIYLHRFIGSDPDRGLHDHPWDCAYSLILSGWYVEERWANIYQGELTLAMKSFLSLTRITGDDQHRVVMDEGAVTWSLFWHSKWCKGWGFYKYSHIREQVDIRTANPGHSGGNPGKWWLTAGRRGVE